MITRTGRRDARWMSCRGVALALVLLLPAPAMAQSLAAGSRAPEIELSKLQGGKVKLSNLRGHPVVVTFWGTWCPPCREEFPELDALYRKHHGEGLEVLAVNQRDQELSTKDVQAFVDEFAVTFPVLLDPRGRSRRNFRLIALPTTVFIDSGGIIREVHSGPISRDQLARGVATIVPAR
jgi:thiol-disulfide isomerase/thioredoxin